MNGRISVARKKEKYEFLLFRGAILYLAGIYHKDPEGGRFTILTREAEGCMTGIHSRMPLILRKEDMKVWLFSKQGQISCWTDALLVYRERMVRRTDIGK